jgi:adenylate kinase family enzyme
MIVEFIGPPAAGKSTIEEALATNLGVNDSHRWALQGRSEILQEAGRATIIRPLESATLLRRLLDTRQEKLWYYPYLWAYGTALFRFISQCPSNKFCVLDQGPIQFLWGVGMSGMDHSQFAEYVLDIVRESEHDYMVVDVKVSAEELKRRLKNRDHGQRMEVFRRETFDRGLQLSEELADFCQRKEPVQYVKIDGEAPPESNIGDILTELENWE